jgi:hypothetical protein
MKGEDIRPPLSPYIYKHGNRFEAMPNNQVLKVEVAKWSKFIKVSEGGGGGVLVFSPMIGVRLVCGYPRRCQQGFVNPRVPGATASFRPSQTLAMYICSDIDNTAVLVVYLYMFAWQMSAIATIL